MSIQLAPINRDFNIQLDIHGFIKAWNMKWPMDRYIRKKYGIIFGSPAHRALNFIDMAIELKEDQVLEQLEEQKLDQELQATFGPEFLKIKKNQANNKGIKMTQKEIDKEFANLDLSQFNDK